MGELNRNSANEPTRHGPAMTSDAGTMGTSRLAALLESAHMLHSSRSLEELLGHLLRTVMGRLLAGRGLIAIEDKGVVRLAMERGMRGLRTGDLYSEEAARAENVETFFPIGDAARPIGLLGVAQPRGKVLEPEEQEFVKALLGIAASGINKAQAHVEASRLNQALGQRVQELRTLLDLARGLSRCLDPDQVAQLLGLTLAGRWAVRKYAIAAWRDGHPRVSRQKGMTLPDLGIHRAAWSELPEAGVVDNLPAGDLKEALRAMQAVLVFPLRSSDNIIGIVAVGPRAGKNPYSDADLEFGAGVAAQAVVAFENAWYFRETVEKRRMEEELALAASIQARLFPDSLPELHRCEIAALNRPALECGGDYYDVLPLGATGEDSPHLFCVADVSGKGLPASLLMSNLQANLRASVGYAPELVDLASRTNDLLYATTPPEKYITSILLHLDPVTGFCRYVNAGHHGGVLLRADGTTVPLETTGTPLGLLAGMTYLAGNVALQPGDVLVLFSDGVPEAFDTNEEEWGAERMLDCLSRCRHESASEIIRRLLEEVDAFVGSAPPHDDITLLVLKRAV